VFDTEDKKRNRFRFYIHKVPDWPNYWISPGPCSCLLPVVHQVFCRFRNNANIPSMK